MDIKKKYGVDQDLAIKGVWITIDTDGTKIQVARAGNRRFNKILTDKRRDEFARLKTTILNEDDTLRTYQEAFVEAILLDWDGITEGGKKITYTKEEALRMIKEYPDFYKMVSDLSEDMERYLIKYEDNTQKNSVPPSTGNSDIALT